MTPVKHAMNSAAKFGGFWGNYIHIHDWFDATKQHTGDWTHRALRHHSQGVQQAIKKFGHAVTIVVDSDPDNIRCVPVKSIAEQHIIEDCGFIPTVKDWLSCIQPKPWMLMAPRQSEPKKIVVMNEKKKKGTK